MIAFYIVLYLFVAFVATCCLIRRQGPASDTSSLTYFDPPENVVLGLLWPIVLTVVACWAVAKFWYELAKKAAGR